MRLLLDTHTFLWFIADDPRLSTSAKVLLESDVDLFLSVASLWEIAIKVSVGKLVLPEDYDVFVTRQLAANEIEVLAIEVSHLRQVASLPFHHRDPFDRLLIAQAITDGMPIVSTDSVLDAYKITRRW